MIELYKLNRMGQCMPEAQKQTYSHPSLGLLQKHYLSGIYYYITVRQMDNQQSYICWSKKINKMRSLYLLKNVLYLPIKQFWRGGSGTSSHGRLQLFFEPYQLTLFQMVMSHKLTKTYPKQSFLWELCYSVLKYLHSFKQIQFQHNSLSFQNILVDYKGSVKIVSEAIIAHEQINSQNRKQIEGIQNKEFQLPEATTFVPQKQRITLLQLSGIICLSTAALLDVSNLQENNHLAWRNMSLTLKNEALTKCKDRYSNQLAQVLTDMISSTKPDNLGEFIQKIEIFMPEVQLGFYGSLKDKVVKKDDYISLKLPKIEQMKSECHKDNDIRSTIQTIIFEQNDTHFPLQSYLTIL